MNKRKLYAIIAVISVISIYGYDHFLNTEASQEIIAQGEIEKENTNSFYLPTSTTNQIVHHN